MRWECRERFPRHGCQMKTLVRDPHRHASRHVHNARAVINVGITNPWCRGKRSRHSRRMRNPKFCVYGKTSILCYVDLDKKRLVSLSYVNDIIKVIQAWHSNNDEHTPTLEPRLKTHELSKMHNEMLQYSWWSLSASGLRRLFCSKDTDSFRWQLTAPFQTIWLRP